MYVCVHACMCACLYKLVYIHINIYVCVGKANLMQYKTTKCNTIQCVHIVHTYMRIRFFIYVYVPLYVDVWAG